MTDVQIEKRLAQQKRSQERARQRQIEKQRSPEYRAKQREKQRATAERQRAKALANKDKQLEKARAQAKAQRTRAIERAELKGPNSPTRNKPIKFKGMAGKARTKSDMSLHDKLGQLGCICCINAGLIQPFSGSPVSIHHIRGRTITDAHKYVLPLCAWHHDTPVPQDSGVSSDIFPIHSKGSEGGRVRWEEVNGKQHLLLEQVMELVGEGHY
ncbi:MULTISPECIES: Ref family recombination enhancement nuclease [Salinimonas]|uniref:Recombination enhancement function protein n=2 Tax=Salinimonas TaxID=288793 RepID=A0A5B7YJN0_9ALTE|nr:MULTISPECIES: Ref family recombination enhancement nuclease [Salinimonas]MBD3587531.1 recombination enhancement function protein [Salinimonas profundi]QCZ95556.1 recombination enhancement function protein [Salinimonas iocasae]